MQYNNKKSIAIKWYRAENFFYRHKMRLIAQFIYHMMQLVLGCTIPYSADLGEGVNIAHFHGIVIHHKSSIGERTVIYQNVTLGGRNGKTGPCVGKNCVIGAGACILGDIKIGDNVNIGANAVVLEDIPDNCTAVGVPARIIKHNEE
ncbi:serine O-acetyltransferase [Blautia schinkii]|nr:serine O-acetyltransferase [Blautia schinkii]